MVRISGSHPGGPGSIPGNGILFQYLFTQLKLQIASFQVINLKLRLGKHLQLDIKNLLENWIEHELANSQENWLNKVLGFLSFADSSFMLPLTLSWEQLKFDSWFVIRFSDSLNQ